MPELQLKSHRFRQEREADWRRLDRLLGRVEKGSAASLSYEEMVALPELYRSALSSLSVARAISLDHRVSRQSAFTAWGQARAKKPERRSSRVDRGP